MMWAKSTKRRPVRPANRPICQAAALELAVLVSRLGGAQRDTIEAEIAHLSNRDRDDRRRGRTRSLGLAYGVTEHFAGRDPSDGDARAAEGQCGVSCSITRPISGNRRFVCATPHR